MNQRAKRYLILPAVGMAIFTILLAYLEGERRRRPLAEQPMLDGSGQALSAEELVQKYQNSAELAQLCGQVRERFAAVHERTRTSSHTRTTRLTEYDKRGNPVSIMETTEHVWFEGDREKTQLIRQRVLLGSETSSPLGKSNLSNPVQQAHLPFPRNAGEDDYAYRFDGVEEIEGRPAGRIHFEPRTNAGLGYRGWAWVAMETGEPVFVQLAPVKPPPFVNRLEVMLDYGRAENGHNQARRAVFDGSGGFAFLTKHLRVESELSDYQESQESRAKSQEPNGFGTPLSALRPSLRKDVP